MTIDNGQEGYPVIEADVGGNEPGEVAPPWTPPTSGGGGGGLLGVGVGDGSSQYSTNSQFFAPVDAAHLTVAFTAPASGRVLVRLSGLIQPPYTDQPDTSLWSVWGVLDHTTGDQYGKTVGPIDNMPNATVESGTPDQCVSVPLLITGLTAGKPYQFDWGHAVATNSPGTTATAYVVNWGETGPGQGAAGSTIPVMEVWSA